MSAVRRFALDHNFPDPIVSVLVRSQPYAELVRVDAIDEHTPDLEDWQLLLALHHHRDDWDGMITTDISMLNQGRELAAMIQTKLTVVVAEDAGHDPVKASGLLFAHLDGLCKRTNPGSPQAWVLRAASRPHQEPWELLRRFADHNNRELSDVWDEFRLSPHVLATDPLGA